MFLNRSDDVRVHIEAAVTAFERVAKLDAVCRAHGVPLAAAAIQFPLGHAKVSSVVIGAISPDEIRQNFELMRLPIPAALWSDLRGEGLLRADAPLPT